MDIASARVSVKMRTRRVSFTWEVKSPVIRTDAFFTGSFKTDEEMTPWLA